LAEINRVLGDNAYFEEHKIEREQYIELRLEGVKFRV